MLSQEDPSCLIYSMNTRNLLVTGENTAAGKDIFYLKISFV
ncbi:hypothetical protein [Morganella morganii IS15]|nr:hypothetical protein CSB69_2102 [Morganella morganii]EMP50268.1 hypothetical protein C790_02148 [Morganella morganii SC01]CDK66392.1 hypothetical protein [Morganella morganii IS15]